MKKALFFLWIIISLFLLASFVEAGVYITPATGGENILINTVGGSWTSLGPIIIREGMPGDIKTGDTIFVIPDGFEINTQSSPSVVVSGGTELTTHLSSVSSREIRITVDQPSVVTSHTLTLGNITPIKVRPTSSNLPSGNIYISTSTIEGVLSGPNGTSFGKLQTIALPPTQEEKTIAELTAKVIELQQKIIEVLNQLIQILQKKIAEL